MASIKIKDFFNGRFFEIPKYQRGYAWEIENIRELFDDIVESIESNSNHYIGTLVLSKSETDEEKFFVVDGQQRITTITLIISKIIQSLGQKDADYYGRFYIQEEGRYRLSPLNRDNRFFTNILEGTIGEPENKSQRYLVQAADEINNKIQNIQDKLKFLKSIEKLEVMEFVENSEGDAIRIFQTVNDRGKPLSNMEKAKSLLIYFSNRYLQKRLDNLINDHFSDIFEIYDDIKHHGEDLRINLIRNKEFNEDNLMRYHFVTFSNEDYDPSAHYVLQYLKNTLIKARSAATDADYSVIEQFIQSYISSLKNFFYNCNKVISKAKEDPKYYKVFVILNLSATLYPLVVKLESMGMLDSCLSGTNRTTHSFLDLVELIEVRVYKTRGTDPKADIAKLVYQMSNWENFEIENWLVWFNQRWMSKEQFQSNLTSNIYGNRALNHIFITYCEHLQGREFMMVELNTLVALSLNVEHVLSQTPKFAVRALGFKNAEDFINHEHTVGNLTLLEKGLNSSVQNKAAIDKIDTYDRSKFIMTKQLASMIHTSKAFTKADILRRTNELMTFCSSRWWCEFSENEKIQNTVVN